jgi:hypothetical protein
MEQTGAFPPGYSDSPEAVHGTGTNPVANGHHAPELFKPAGPGLWNGNPGGSLPHATVSWWRRYWIAAEKKKNDSQLVGPLAGTGTGLGVTTYVLSC